MSRAFVKEPDGDQVEDDLPERPLSGHTNYVTPRGLRQLEQRLRTLRAQQQTLESSDALGAKQQLKRVQRDLRYVRARLESAVPVSPEPEPTTVRFGSCVEVLDEDGIAYCFTLVGEDEADAGAGLISWVAPLAKALLNARCGDEVVWERPAGDRVLEITAIRPGSD